MSNYIKDGGFVYFYEPTENNDFNANTHITPTELREQAYNTAPCIQFGGEILTITQAAQQWAYYAAEGRTDKTDALTILIASAKDDIRAQYPD